MIGSCPECGEAIRIPEGALKQLVRCPLCTAEYELEQVFDQLPPMLEIVGNTSDGIGIQIEAAGELELANADSSDSASSAVRYQPQQRKQKSAFAEILKIVLGGALALPIGVLCVWWFAGRAPFGFAEKVSEYVPWIVPEKLRNGDNIDDSDLDPDDANSADDDRSKAVNAFRQNANRNLNKEPTSKGVLGIKKSVEDDFSPDKEGADVFKKDVVGNGDKQPNSGSQQGNGGASGPDNSNEGLQEKKNSDVSGDENSDDNSKKKATKEKDSANDAKSNDANSGKQLGGKF